MRSFVSYKLSQVASQALRDKFRMNSYFSTSISILYLSQYLIIYCTIIGEDIYKVTCVGKAFIMALIQHSKVL